MNTELLLRWMRQGVGKDPLPAPDISAPDISAPDISAPGSALPPSSEWTPERPGEVDSAEREAPSAESRWQGLPTTLAARYQGAWAEITYGATNSGAGAERQRQAQLLLESAARSAQALAQGEAGAATEAAEQIDTILRLSRHQVRAGTSNQRIYSTFLSELEQSTLPGALEAASPSDDQDERGS